MIQVFGTSHVSKDSISLIDEKLEEIDPEIVALELDWLRLNALMSDMDRGGGSFFLRAIRAFQRFVGAQTGSMPGEEMKHAYQKSIEQDREVALIDQDIRETVHKMKNVRYREKFKVLAYLVVGVFFNGRFDLSKIPDDDIVQEMLFEFKFLFPELYEILVEERNRHMARSLKQVQEEHPDKDIVAFVGSAHKKGVYKELNDLYHESSSQD